MSRELYDLCRRYKHYWKNVEDVKHLNDKYHDLDLTSALSHSCGQLCETEDEMLKQLFRDYCVMCDKIETHNEIQEPCFSSIRDCLAPPRVVGSLSTLHIQDSRRFIGVLCDYLNDRRIGK